MTDQRTASPYDYASNDSHAPGHEAVVDLTDGAAEIDLTTPTNEQYSVPELEELIDEAISMVAQGRPLPMSSTVKVNKAELMEVLEEIREALPEELRRARWLLKEKEEFLAQARQERQEIIDQGRAQVARMIERQEITRAAEARARQIVAEARADARTLQRRVEDYCDHKLASFEAVLERTSRTLQQGREKLLGTAAAEGEIGNGPVGTPSPQVSNQPPPPPVN
ncbi:MAG: hypothetical protein HKN03_15140 [Acidimicrobiales bacterium]|nr:hypothetical protein [Acidimicrobiales bacterium]